MIKDYVPKSTSINGENLDACLYNQEQECLLLLLLFNIVLEVEAPTIKKRKKKIKTMRIGRYKIKKR